MIVLSLVLAGCARDAPALPASASSAVQLSPSEQALDCDQIDIDLAENKQQMEKMNASIKGDRGSNQAIGYVAAVALPPLALAANSHTQEKEALDRLQVERDRLYSVKRAKACVAQANSVNQ